MRRRRAWSKCVDGEAPWWQHLGGSTYASGEVFETATLPGLCFENDKNLIRLVRIVLPPPDLREWFEYGIALVNLYSNCVVSNPQIQPYNGL